MKFEIFKKRKNWILSETIWFFFSVIFPNEFIGFFELQFSGQLVFNDIQKFWKSMEIFKKKIPFNLTKIMTF